jgi:hypothetical protein
VRQFVAALDAQVPEARARPASAVVAELWGAPLPPDLARLVDVLGAQPERAEPRLGEFLAFSPVDWLPGAANSFDWMLAEWFRRAALFAARSRARHASLRGAIAACVRRSVASKLDTDEMPVLAADDTIARFERCGDLRATLWHGGVDRLAAAGTGSDTAALVERALRAFLRGDATLGDELATAAAHPARLLRDLAASLANHADVAPSERLSVLGTVESY